jgi:hypothetical protein
MPREPIDFPPNAAKAFMRDLKAFFKEENPYKRDEIAARQLHALREHLRPGEKLKLTHVHEIFLAMKGQAGH